MFDQLTDKLDRAADVGDEARLLEVESRQNILYDEIDAGVLEANGVQHAARRLPHPMGWVAEPRCQRRALEHDRAHGGVRKPLDTRVFLAEADATGHQHHG
jgi:hypothetical protein